MSNEVIELLEELTIFENNLSKDMVINDKEIIQGINIVRKIIYEINPDKIDQKFKNSLLMMLNNHEKQLLSRMKLIDNYTKYGISRCLLIIDRYVNFKSNIFPKKKVLIN